MSVQRVRAGDVLRLERTPVELDPAHEFVTIGVRSFGKGIFHYDAKPGDQLGKLRFFALEPNRLVVSNIKGWEGAIAVSSEAEVGCIASNRFLIYAPADGRVDVNWARWFFLSEVGLPLIQQASPGSADRNRTLAIERFENLEIPLPPLGEQRVVVEALDGVQERARALQYLMSRADRLSSALPSSLAMRPDLDDHVRKLAGWRRIPLSDVMTPADTRVPVHPDRAYRVAGTYSFGRGLIDRGAISGSETSYKEFSKLAIGEVVVSKLNGWEGAVAVVPPPFDGCYVSSEYPVFKVDRSALLPGFFDGVARSPVFWAELDRMARGSMVRRRRINPSEFLRAEIWVPPLDEQAAIARQIASVVALSNRRGASVDRTDALVPAALNQAFAGLG